MGAGAHAAVGAGGLAHPSPGSSGKVDVFHPSPRLPFCRRVTSFSELVIHTFRKCCVSVRACMRAVASADPSSARPLKSEANPRFGSAGGEAGAGG